MSKSTYAETAPRSADGHTQLPPADEPFPLTIDNKRFSNDPILDMVHLRGQVGSLPETTQTFTLHRLETDDYTKGPRWPYILEMLGSWPVPDRIAGGTAGVNRNRYVNPNSPDAWMLSDAYLKCECGALVTSACPRTQDSMDIPGLTKHEDCRSIWLNRATTQLWQNRRVIARRMLRLGLTSSSIGHRAGYRSQCFGDRLLPHDIDVRSERDVYRQKVALTALHARDHHPTRTICDAFDVCEATLNTWIHDHIDGDVDLYKNRYRS